MDTPTDAASELDTTAQTEPRTETAEVETLEEGDDAVVENLNDARELQRFRSETHERFERLLSEFSELEHLTDAESWASLLRFYDEIYCREAPQERPFEYRYVARGLLERLKERVQEFCTAENATKVELYTAVLNHRLGVNFSETEENSNAEKVLQAAHAVLVEQVSEESNYLFVDELIDTNNQLGILWANRSENRKAYAYLTSARKIYKKYKSYAPTTSQRTENIHTLTLYYLAQVYGHFGKQILSSKYIHATLKRQLDSMTYEPLSWCKHCMQLAGYYITVDSYAFAEHCLMAVDKILPVDVEETHRANLNILWARYYLGLLKLSRVKKVRGESPVYPTKSEETLRLPQIAKGHDGAESSDDQDEDEDVRLDCLSMLPSLSPPKPSITLASTYEEARVLFLKGSDYCTKAKEQFPLNGFVTDHVAVVQDMSSFYRNLVFFETDLERRIKMHRRRLGMLEPLLEQLNPAYYLDIVNQLNFEVAETYQEMAEFKFEQSRVSKETEGKKPSAKKTNEYLLQAIKYYETFIKSIQKDGKTITKVSDEVLEPFLTAHFCLARLYSKLIPPDIEAARQSLTKSLSEYKWILQYYEKFPFDIFTEEMGLCREMVQLLPIKISNIARPEMRS